MTDLEKRQKAKEYLVQIQRMDNRVQENLLELERLNAAVTQCTAVISDMPRGATKSTEDMIIKYVDLSNELNSEIDLYVEYKRNAKSLIQKLDEGICESLIRKRYFNYKPWGVIRFELNYSERQIFNVHEKALLKVYELLEDCSKVQ